MIKVTSFEAAALSVSKLLVKQLNTQMEEVDREFNLVMDFNAIAKAQELLGKDLVDVKNWQGLTSSETITICWCAMQRFHPEITLDEVRGMLPPAASVEVSNMLLEMAFPGIIERIDKLMAEAQEKAKAAAGE